MLDLLRQFFSSIGEITKVCTLCDFYNYGSTYTYY